MIAWKTTHGESAEFGPVRFEGYFTPSKYTGFELVRRGLRCGQRWQEVRCFLPCERALLDVAKTSLARQHATQPFAVVAGWGRGVLSP
jgi:hypothetical protein